MSEVKTVKPIEMESELNLIMSLAEAIEHGKIWCENCLAFFDEYEIAEYQTSCHECHAVDSLVEDIPYTASLIYAKAKALKEQES